MTNKLLIHFSRALSWALHPLVLPLYLVALLFTQTAFALFPTAIKWYLAKMVILYGTILPMVVIGLLYLVGRLKSFKLQRCNERMLPLFVGMLCYFLCAYAVHTVPQADFLRKFMLAAACCELLCLVVTSEWKISLHLTAMGAAVAMLLVLNTLGLTQLFPWLILTVLATGLLASARLYLGYHNSWQILAGFMGGFVITWIALLFM